MRVEGWLVVGMDIQYSVPVRKVPTGSQFRSHDYKIPTNARFICFFFSSLLFSPFLTPFLFMKPFLPLNGEVRQPASAIGSPIHVHGRLVHSIIYLKFDSRWPKCISCELLMDIAIPYIFDGTNCSPLLLLRLLKIKIAKSKNRLLQIINILHLSQVSPIDVGQHEERQKFYGRCFFPTTYWNYWTTTTWTHTKTGRWSLALLWPKRKWHHQKPKWSIGDIYGRRARAFGTGSGRPPPTTSSLWTIEPGKFRSQRNRRNGDSSQVRKT